VAISTFGAAREHLKFDRSSCPVGTRFSFEIALDGEADGAEADRREIARVAALILAPYARFGGAGRRGLSCTAGWMSRRPDETLTIVV
jgi:hypothetical protein